MSTRTLAIALLLATTGCLFDGRYVVRGTITGAGPEQRRLAGATASVADCVPTLPPHTAVTDEQGGYELACRYGGVCFLFLCSGVDDTTVRFAAPGHEPRSANLLEARPDDRVTRRNCASARQKKCFELDVTLDPAPVR